MLSVRECKEEARERLRGNWGTAALVTLASAAPGVCLAAVGLAQTLGSMEARQAMIASGRVFAAMLDQMKMGAVYAALYCVISGALMLALARFYLRMREGEKSRFGVFLEGLNGWTRGITALLLVSLKLLVWYLGLFAAMLALTAGVFVAASGGAAGALAAIRGFAGAGAGALPEGLLPALLAFFLGWAALTAVMANRSIAYSQVMFVRSEYPDVSAARALRASIAMTRGRRWKLFLLDVSFVGWSMLALLTLGIGLLWLAPYWRAAHAAAYRALKAEASAAPEGEDAGEDGAAFFLRAGEGQGTEAGEGGSDAER